MIGLYLAAIALLLWIALGLWQTLAPQMLWRWLWVTPFIACWLLTLFFVFVATGKRHYMEIQEL